MISKNPLDVLFRDIQKQVDQEVKDRKRPPTAPHQSTYANPLNWRTGKVIQLIHATDGPLGLFQEYFHILSPSARRLLPCAGSLQIDRDELVFGDFWLHPKFRAPETDSEAEIRAITLRFNELMEEEFDEE